MSLHYMAVPIMTASITAGCSGTSSVDVACPTKQAAQVGGRLDLTAEEVGRIRDELAEGTDVEIARVADNLRRLHPNATRGAITNLLITAYCPNVALDSGGDRQQQQEIIRDFASRTRRVVDGTVRRLASEPTNTSPAARPPD